ncbi:MAG: hypothetical protein ACYC26_10245 [Phycisphaerales bacterium]
MLRAFKKLGYSLLCSLILFTDSCNDSGHGKNSQRLLFYPTRTILTDETNNFASTCDRHFAAIIAINENIRRDLTLIIKELGNAIAHMQPNQDLSVVVVYRDQSHTLSGLPTYGDNQALISEINLFCKSVNAGPVLDERTYPWAGLLDAMGTKTDQGLFILSVTDVSNMNSKEVFDVAGHVRDGLVRKNQRINCFVWHNIKSDTVKVGEVAPAMILAREIARTTEGHFRVLLRDTVKSCGWADDQAACCLTPSMKRMPAMMSRINA